MFCLIRAGVSRIPNVAFPKILLRNYKVFTKTLLQILLKEKEYSIHNRSLTESSARGRGGPFLAKA